MIIKYHLFLLHVMAREAVSQWCELSEWISSFKCIFMNITRGNVYEKS